MELKIACLGGGSIYFGRCLRDLVTCDELAGSEIVLYDLDVEKAEVVAATGRRLAGDSGLSFTVRAAAELADAVDGAHVAVSSIGGSGAEITPNVYGSYYHQADVHIAAKYGVYQAIGDTGGPVGMMMALRAIPAYLHICREMEQRCPGAALLNHSNPMAALCRAMRKHTGVHVVGICHGVPESVARFAGILGLPAKELDCAWIGTNHYYWFTRLEHRGRDVLPELLTRLGESDDREGERLFQRLSQIYGYPIGCTDDRHMIEFYPYLSNVSSLDHVPPKLAEGLRRVHESRGGPAPERNPDTPEARAAFFEKYRGILDTAELLTPEQTDDTMREHVADLIGCLASGREGTFIVNVPNDGAIPNLPDTALVEVEGVTESGRVRALPAGECPLHLKGILEKRFVWHELVADAAVQGDRNLALQALLVDEMAVWPDRTAAMLDELLTASRDLLPQFFEA